MRATERVGGMREGWVEDGLGGGTDRTDGTDGMDGGDGGAVGLEGRMERSGRMEGSPRLATPLCRRRVSTLVGV